MMARRGVVALLGMEVGGVTLLRVMEWVGATLPWVMGLARA